MHDKRGSQVLLLKDELLFILQTYMQQFICLTTENLSLHSLTRVPVMDIIIFWIHAYKIIKFSFFFTK